VAYSSSGDQNTLKRIKKEGLINFRGLCHIRVKTKFFLVSGKLMKNDFAIYMRQKKSLKK
jgi:hypothetical protein